jgi:hypothetical protein
MKTDIGWAIQTPEGEIILSTINSHLRGYVWQAQQNCWIAYLDQFYRYEDIQDSIDRLKATGYSCVQVEVHKRVNPIKRIFRKVRRS